MTTRVLIDTSFLVALFVVQDKNHQLALSALRDASQWLLTVPEVVLPEFFYVTAIRTNYRQALHGYTELRAINPDKVTLQDVDLVRIEAIMTQYQDAYFDFVDTAIMALSERLDVQTIFTFDQRDFSIFRPRHCDYLVLRP